MFYVFYFYTHVYVHVYITQWCKSILTCFLAPLQLHKRVNESRLISKAFWWYFKTWFGSNWSFCCFCSLIQVLNMSVRQASKKAMDEALEFVKLGMDREGLEKRFIDESMGKFRWKLGIIHMVVILSCWLSSWTWI